MTISRKTKQTVAAIVLLILAQAAHAQSAAKKKFDPVQWSLTAEPAEAVPGGRVVARLTATIEQGWRLYAPSTPTDGPVGGPLPTELALAESPAIKSWKFFQPPPVVKHDPNFQMDSEIYQGEAVFWLEAELSDDTPLGELALEASARYSACDDKICLRPVRKTAQAVVMIAATSAAATPPFPADYAEAKPAEKGVSSATAPAAGQLGSSTGSTTNSSTPAGSQSLFEFAAVAFGFGLLAIFTPCVFPMIPITMSYFVSTGSTSRRQSIVQALTFCAGIVICFTGLGALVSVVLGPFGTVQLGSSVWVNLFIALIFGVFAVSLFGVFEITVPSGALTSLDRLSRRGGTAGVLMMGLVFALASFACTGPFVGTLLAGSVQGGLAWPVFGMAMFSSGMALPFFALALFPAYLKKLPKSGGWLGRVKKTMAFLILAAAVKYLSNVDLVYQWEILTRERFLAIWIVLLTLAAFYLLGFFRFPDEPPTPEPEPVGLGRLSMSAAFLVVALSLVPGMFGGRLGELDAYVPPPEYSGISRASLGGSAAEKSTWIKDDYEGALAKARASGKSVLVSFTGYSCSNCKWMKYNMFTKPAIAELTSEMILVELYTDGQDDVTAANQDLQLNRFGSVAIPHYAIVRPDETIAAEFSGRTRDVEEFRGFLRSGA